MSSFISIRQGATVEYKIEGEREEVKLPLELIFKCSVFTSCIRCSLVCELIVHKIRRTNAKFNYITVMNPLYQQYQPPCLIVPLLFCVSSFPRNVRQSRDNALVYASVFVTTKRDFSEPLSSNGLFSRNMYLPSTPVRGTYSTDLILLIIMACKQRQ
jgi:hypothetical protein